MSVQPRRPRGLSNRDVLVILGVVLAAVAIMIPATYFSASRQRRLRCRENLRALGLALGNYHDQHQVLPPGIVVPADPTGAAPCDFVARSGTCDLPEQARASGQTMLLPFMEGNATYERYNHRYACCSMQNATASATWIEALLCPENPRRSAQPILWAYYQCPPTFVGPAGVAANDYVFNAGALAAPVCGSPCLGKPLLPAHFVRSAGPFGVNSSVRFGDVKDGLSNTILMGECAGGGMLFAGTEERHTNFTVRGDRPMRGIASVTNCD